MDAKRRYHKLVDLNNRHLLSQFWGLNIWDQVVDKAMFSERALRKNLLLAYFLTCNNYLTCGTLIPILCGVFPVHVLISKFFLFIRTQSSKIRLYSNDLILTCTWDHTHRYLFYNFNIFWVRAYISHIIHLTIKLRKQTISGQEFFANVCFTCISIL